MLWGFYSLAPGVSLENLCVTGEERYLFLGITSLLTQQRVQDKWHLIQVILSPQREWCLLDQKDEQNHESHWAGTLGTEVYGFYPAFIILQAI